MRCPLAKSIPLATLAAVLVIVAWNISEVDHFRTLLKAPKSDALVLLTTFGLTVFADLTIAVGVGMVLAAMLFMKRMAEVSNVSTATARRSWTPRTPRPSRRPRSPRAWRSLKSTVRSSSASPTV